MEVTASENTDTESLASIFQDGLDLYNNLGKIDEPTNSAPVQMNVNKAIKLLENATRLVSLAGIFSSNEDVEEIPTENLRYLLLPALLGTLCLKLTSGNRKEITEVAEIYYKDFLQRCNDYGLSNFKFNDTDSSERTVEAAGTSERSEMEKIQYSVNTRANKIHKFKEQKELKSKLEELKRIVDQEHVDDEVKRKYFLTMIQLFIHESVDELGSIESEKQILEHMANMVKEDKPKFKRPPSQPLKPIIITKDAAQKSVFGAGYPSLPVMSVEEFYEQRVQQGIFPDPSKKKNEPMSLVEAAAAGSEEGDEDVLNEAKVENDDDEYLEQMRQKDEFKDDHRRGWGNRMNRS